MYMVNKEDYLKQDCMKTLTSFDEFRKTAASWEWLLIRALIFLKDATTDIGTIKQQKYWKEFKMWLQKLDSNNSRKRISYLHIITL